MFVPMALGCTRACARDSIFKYIKKSPIFLYYRAKTDEEDWKTEMSKNFVVDLTDQEIEKLKAYLARNNFVFRTVNYALFSAADPAQKATLTVYESKKLVLQGKETEGIKKGLAEEVLGFKDDRERDDDENDSWIGTDESGKGDYFGPLVIAGVYVDEKSLSKLKALNVRDSKRITDSVAKKMAEDIKASSSYSIVLIGPQKYNELFEKMKNLNIILAWGHARVIENLLRKVNCRRVITDKFGDEKFVKNALMKKGKMVSLEQKFRAEDDIAVAAASILARAAFLSKLKELSKEVSLELPKGASSAVEEAAQALVKKHGQEVLTKAAKVHFKTTQKVITALRALNE